MKGKKILAWELLLNSYFPNFKSLIQAAKELAKTNGATEDLPTWTCTQQGTLTNPYTIV